MPVIHKTAAVGPSQPVKNFHANKRPPLVEQAFTDLRKAIEFAEKANAYPEIREQANALLAYVEMLEAVRHCVIAHMYNHDVAGGCAAVYARNLSHAVNPLQTRFISGPGAGPDGRDGMYYAMREGETNDLYVTWFNTPIAAMNFADVMNKREGK